VLVPAHTRMSLVMLRPVIPAFVCRLGQVGLDVAVRRDDGRPRDGAAVQQTGRLLRAVVVALAVESAVAGRRRRGGVAVATVGDLLRLLAHLGDLDVVVGDNGGYGGDEAEEVDEGELVAKDEGGGGNGNDLLEDASNGQRDYRGALEQCKLGCCHTESDASRKQQEERRHDDTPLVGQGLESLPQGAHALYRDGERDESHKHDGSQKEDAREGVRCRGIPEQ